MDQHCYIIVYDLCRPGRDYEALYRALKSFPGWGAFDGINLGCGF